MARDAGGAGGAGSELVASVSRDRVVAPPGVPASRLALFTAFLEVALSAFGGALAFARQILVQRRRWLTDREFAETLGLCQALPGPNVVNMSVFIGTRFHGAGGALAAVSGLLGVPVALALVLGALYTEYGSVPVVQSALRGLSAVAAGLVIANAARLLRVYRREPLALLVAAAACAGVTVLHGPLVLVVAVLAPVSIGLAWWRRRA